MSDRLQFPGLDEDVEVEVTASYLEGTETATVDDNGVLRDSEGMAYSPRVYEIVNEN